MSYARLNTLRKNFHRMYKVGNETETFTKTVTQNGIIIIILPILLTKSKHCDMWGNCRIFLHFLLFPLLLSDPPCKKSINYNLTYGCKNSAVCTHPLSLLNKRYLQLYFPVPLVPVWLLDSPVCSGRKRPVSINYK